MGDTEAKVTMEVTLPNLLSTIVDRGYSTEDDDVYGVVTLGDLVAGQIAAHVVSNADVEREVRHLVRVRVRQLVDLAMAGPPDSTDRLHTMIIAEARAQLQSPTGYAGTSTPLAQYIGSEVYKAIREPAMAAVANIQAQVDEAVQAEIKKQLEKIAMQTAKAFTP